MKTQYKTELIPLLPELEDNPEWDKIAKAAFRCGFASIHPDDGSPYFDRPDLSELHAFAELILKME